MTVANIITIIRICLIPLFVYFFAAGQTTNAFITFCIAGGSDFIDGTVARLLRQRSYWGAVLDPIADKLLMETAFICLVITGILPVWFLALALTRDLMIVGGIIYLRWRHVDFPHRAIWSSKLATLAQMLTIGAGLVVMWRPAFAWGGVSMRVAMDVFMWCAAALIVVSAVQYVRLAFSVLAAARRR